MSGVDALRQELADVCVGRDLSNPARARLAELVATGTADEIEAVLAHLRWIPVVRLGDVVVDPVTAAGLRRAWAEHLARIEEQRRRLAGTAYRLGEQVAAYEVTLADAKRRLAAVAARGDDDSDLPSRPPLLDPVEAQQIIADAFGRGFTRRAA